MKSMSLFFIFALGLSFVAPPVLAQEVPENQDGNIERAPAQDLERIRARDEEVAMRAKRRQFPGGPDEGELRVQNPLPKPTRKATPNMEDEKPDSSED